MTKERRDWVESALVAGLWVCGLVAAFCAVMAVVSITHFVERRSRAAIICGIIGGKTVSFEDSAMSLCVMERSPSLLIVQDGDDVYVGTLQIKGVQEARE